MLDRVTVIFTYACNSQCLMCVLPNLGNPHFSADDVKETIDELDLQPGDCIELSGGEPTLHKDFFELCEYAVQNSKAEVWLMTNGRVFADKSFTSDFAKTGCKGALIPLFSDKPEVHDEITQASESFNETLKGLENLRDLGVPLIIRFINLRQNHKEAVDFTKFMIERFPKQRILFTGLCLMGHARKRLDKVGASYSAISNSLKPALDIATENMLLACLHFMPVCVFQPSYWKYFDANIYGDDISANYLASIKKTTSDNEFGYPSLCHKCKLKSMCRWQWLDYEKHFGLGELQPQVALDQ